MQPWLNSWSSVGLPAGEHLLLTFDTGIPVMREAAGEDGVRAFKAAPHPAARADLLRYAELYLRGGWYVDAEHEALLPITDVMTWPVAHVLVRRPRGGEFQNQFIGAVPGSALLHEVLTRACANVLDGSDLTILQMTGPTMYTAVVEEYLTQSDASYVVLPTDVVLAGVLQQVHNDAEYKLRGHWRDQIIGTLR
jgi:mannosyltransferase OCH1-like enzyme